MTRKPSVHIGADGRKWVIGKGGIRAALWWAAPSADSDHAPRYVFSETKRDLLSKLPTKDGSDAKAGTV